MVRVVSEKSGPPCISRSGKNGRQTGRYDKGGATRGNVKKLKKIDRARRYEAATPSDRTTSSLHLQPVPYRYAAHAITAARYDRGRQTEQARLH